MRLLNDFFSISDYQCTEDKFTYRVKLHSSHTIYKAHFPDNPITPGVCMIQMATELLEKQINRNLFLNRIHNIKFMNILSPADTESVNIIFSKLTGEDKTCKVNVLIENGEKTFAKMSLIFSYERV